MLELNVFIFYFSYLNGPLGVAQYIHILYLIYYEFKIGVQFDHIVKMSHQCKRWIDSLLVFRFNAND